MIDAIGRIALHLMQWAVIFVVIFGGDVAVQAVFGPDLSGVWVLLVLIALVSFGAYRAAFESDERKIRRCTKETNRLLYNAALRTKRAEERDAKRSAALLARKGWRFKDWTPPGPPDPRPSGLPPSND